MEINKLENIKQWKNIRKQKLAFKQITDRKKEVITKIINESRSIIYYRSLEIKMGRRKYYEQICANMLDN